VLCEEFKVSGVSTKLVGSQSVNQGIIAKHWQSFNNILRINKQWQGKNWVKYGVTKKIGDDYFYMTAIPFVAELDGFDTGVIPAGEYFHYQHVGAMTHLKSSIHQIYKRIIPASDYGVNSERALIHYERYDYRFSWNKPDSIIDIIVPIEPSVFTSPLPSS